MEFRNQTYLTEFILTAFPRSMNMCILLFVSLILIYTLTIVGNSSLIFIIISSPRLHTPMYYFLCNLSFLDLCYSSSSLPKVILDTFANRKRISITGCLVQMNAGLFLGGTECILLAVMAYDRYVAICHPLHYTVYMNWKTCRIITAVMWLGCFIVATVPTISKPLMFCRENRLDHFVCEILALLKLACGDLAFYKIAIFVVSVFTIFTPFVFIVVSYICIILSILKIRSAGGRSKAFSTCASHVIVVFMFYGTSMTMYMGPSHQSSSNLKYISILYGIMTPLLNPLIYSLRNNEVKEAVNKILIQTSASKTV